MDRGAWQARVHEVTKTEWLITTRRREGHGTLVLSQVEVFFMWSQTWLRNLNNNSNCCKAFSWTGWYRFDFSVLSWDGWCKLSFWQLYVCVWERERERQRDWERQRLGGGERESLVKPNYKCSLLNNFWANLVIKPTSGAITVFRGNMRSIDCFKPGIFEFPATAKELARTSSPVTLSHLHPNYIGLTKRGRYFNKIRFLQEAG